MEGKTNFSRRVKQFDGLIGLMLTPVFYVRSTPLCKTPGSSGNYFLAGDFEQYSLQTTFNCLTMTKSDLKADIILEQYYSPMYKPVLLYASSAKNSSASRSDMITTFS